MHKAKHYPIFNKTLAKELEAEGHHLVRYRPNKNKPGFNVYYFSKTDQLLNALEARKKVESHA